jgi:hypothetical protein
LYLLLLVSDPDIRIRFSAGTFANSESVDHQQI